MSDIDIKEETKEKLDIKSTWINLKRTWKYAKSQKLRLFMLVISTITLCAIGAIVPMLSAQVLLKLTNNSLNELLTISLMVFGIEISRNIANYFYRVFTQKFFRETLLALQVDIAKETLQLETSEIDKNSSGIFIDRLNKDASDIADVFPQVNDCLSEIFANIGIMTAVFVINKWLFLYFVVVLIILFYLNKLRMHSYFETDKKFRKIREKNTGLITELVRGIRDIKVLNANDSFMHKIGGKLKESNEERYNMSRINRNWQFFVGSTQDLSSLIFIVLGIYLVNINSLTIASFVIIYMYQNKIFNLLSQSTILIEELKNFNLSAARVFEIIENTKFKKEKFGDKVIKKAYGDFEFKNVSFSYNDGTEILKNISFKIPANKTVSFVGKSGAGKSTIFSLITKLYDNYTGDIFIDNVNIKELTRDSIRDNISIITQSPYIFNFSIKENLKISNENITDEEMIEACKLACFHDFVETLPNKYDTLVGEGGLTLSGGQRQRLAIARALLKKTEIILFDEATSALDNETQESIRQAINNMKDEYTILIIAHRLSTVVDSDKIILIDKGKITDQGTHKELLETSKVYKKLYNNDFKTVNN